MIWKPGNNFLLDRLAFRHNTFKSHFSLFTIFLSFLDSKQSQRQQCPLQLNRFVVVNIYFIHNKFLSPVLQKYPSYNLRARVRNFKHKESGYNPSEHLAISEPQISLISVSELGKVGQWLDFEALNREMIGQEAKQPASEKVRTQARFFFHSPSLIHHFTILEPQNPSIDQCWAALKASINRDFVNCPVGFWCYQCSAAETFSVNSGEKTENSR